MSESGSLLGRGVGMVARNKRYIVWFWLLNLVLAGFGVTAFSDQAHAILDHSLGSARLLNGFDVAVFAELLAKPEFGSSSAPTAMSFYFVALFFVATSVLLPGVFMGYASNYRLPREDFFRACGRNIWRFVRLTILSGVVMGIAAGILFGARAGLIKAAGEGTNEVLPFKIGLAMMLLIVLVMTMLRSVFDLAEADVVLSDQGAVRRSIGTGFRHGFRSVFRLTGSYLLIWVFTSLVMVGGLWVWMKMVPPASVVSAFIVGQLTLMITLAARFWQRGVAVAYWQESMMVPVLRPVPVVPLPAEPVIFEPPLPVEPAAT
jgi:hypothetical protein